MIKKVATMTTLFPFEDPTRRCLKVHEWPEHDQKAWHALFVPGDILDGTVGTGFHWEEATREKYRKGYGRLGALKRAGGRDEGVFCGYGLVLAPPYRPFS